MSEWQTKKASELHDHDVIEGHGMVDWVAGYPYDQIAVHVHSGDRRGSYTLLIPNNQIVSYTRS
jgi:hypothetical protein